MNKHAQKLGRLGGLATAKKLTKKQKQERSKKGNEARWGKKVVHTPPVDTVHSVGV